MNRFFITAVLILSGAACESKPTREHRMTSVELEVGMSVSPRPDDKLESAIMLSPGVQECLRQAVQKKREPQAEIVGQLSAQGSVSAVKISGANDSLRDCLKSEVEQVKAPPGPAGLFKLEISRVQGGKPKSKTILLDMKPVKKFQ